jgi:hypothetical protein
VNGKAGFGRTYGATIEAAVEAAARGSVIADSGFRDDQDAVGAAVAFERLRRVVARHVRLLVGPGWASERGGRDWAAQAFAGALESAASPVGSGSARRPVGSHLAEQAWREAADALGLAHDMLASHLDPDQAPITPDGELMLQPDPAWQAVARLADLALTLDRQGDCLARRLAGGVRSHALSAQAALHLTRLGASHVRDAAGKVVDLARTQRGWPALDEVGLAPIQSSAALPDDPFGQAVALVDALRRFAYDRARHGGTLGADGLRSYPALGVDITRHAVVILRSRYDEAPATLGARLGCDVRPALQRTIDALLAVGKRWSFVYKVWGDIVSVQSAPSRLHLDVLHIRGALATARASVSPEAGIGGQPEAAEAVRDVDVIDVANRLVRHLAPLGRRQLDMVRRAQATDQLLIPIRRLPDAEDVGAGWHGRYSPLPGEAFTRIVRSYTIAANASSQAAAAFDIAASVLRVSAHLAGQAAPSVPDARGGLPPRTPDLSL